MSKTLLCCERSNVLLSDFSSFLSIIKKKALFLQKIQLTMNVVC